MNGFKKRKENKDGKTQSKKTASQEHLECSKRIINNETTAENREKKSLKSNSF